MNVRIGRISQWLTPDHSWCHKCGTTWRFVNPHVTNYSEARGCFPLCEKCWRGLKTPAARLPYYQELWREWERQGVQDSRKWDDIHAAVMNGN